MKIHPKRKADAGLRNTLPQVSRTQDKKVEAREATEHHKSDVCTNKTNTTTASPDPNSVSGNKQTFACVCGFTHQFQGRVNYHKRICKQWKDQQMPAQTNKSLGANTEHSKNPHSLRASLDGNNTTKQFSSHLSINQTQYDPYTPKQKIKLPQPSNDKSWKQLDQELNEILQYSLPMNTLNNLDTAVNNFLSFVHWYLTGRCGILKNSKKETKAQHRTEKEDATWKMLRELKKVVFCSCSFLPVSNTSGNRQKRTGTENNTPSILKNHESS